LKLFVVSKAQPRQCPRQQQQCNPQAPPSMDGLKAVFEQLLNPSNVENFLAKLPDWIQVSVIDERRPEGAQPQQQPQPAPHCGRFRHFHHHPQNVGDFGPRGRGHFWAKRLHHTGLVFFQHKNFYAAKECFEKILRRFPEDNTALYNLACAHSLISVGEENVERKEQEQQKALELLRKAVSCGYSDANHLEADSDFEPIRHRQEFLEVLSSLKRPQQQQQQVPEQQPQQQEEERVIVNNENNEVAPQPQPQPVEEEQIKAPGEFEVELTQLQDMGFNDKERNLALLRRTRGNLGRVLASLLD